MSSAQQAERLEQLVVRQLDGLITNEEATELQSLLTEQEDLQDSYVSMMLLHGELAWRSGAETQQPAEPRRSRWQRAGEAIYDVASNYVALSLLISAITMAIIVLSMGLIDTKPIPATVGPPIDQFVAEINRTNEAVFNRDSDANFANRSLFANDRVLLDHGVAEIRFDDGSSIWIEGPCDLVIESDHRSTLNLGELTAQARKGFTVQTPMATVVDLGTEFSVSVNRLQRTDVHVHEGAISLVSVADGDDTSAPVEKRLAAGENARIESPGEIRTNVSDMTPAYLARGASWTLRRADRAARTFEYDLSGHLGEAGSPLTSDTRWTGDNLDSWVVNVFENVPYLRNRNSQDSTVSRPNDDAFALAIPQTTSKLILEFAGRVGGANSFMEVGLANDNGLLFAAGCHFHSKDLYHVNCRNERTFGGTVGGDAVHDFRLEVDPRGSGRAVLYIDNLRTVVVPDLQLAAGTQITSASQLHVRTNSKYAGPGNIRITAIYDKALEGTTETTDEPNHSLPE